MWVIIMNQNIWKYDLTKDEKKKDNREVLGPKCMEMHSLGTKMVNYSF